MLAIHAEFSKILQSLYESQLKTLKWDYVRDMNWKAEKKTPKENKNHLVDTHLQV